MTEWKTIDDRVWQVPVDKNGAPTAEYAILGVLQDIRRELKQLNALFKDQPFVYYPKGDGK